MDSKSLGKKIKMYRAKCGLVQEACAERIGITPRYLADIERGAKVPKLETFITILNVLSASADDVLQDSLVAGYEAKSNELLKMLDSLDVTRRKQAMDIFKCVIISLQEH